MLLDNRVLAEIDDIIERAYTTFSYRIVGEDYLTNEQKVQVESLGVLIGHRPLIEVLYLLARKRNTPGYVKDKALNRIIEEILASNILPTLNDESQYTVQHAKAAAQEAINNAKATLKKEIKTEILTANTQFKELLSANPVLVTPQLRQEEKEKAGLSLLTKIGIVTTAATALWMFRREITDVMTQTINSSEVDQIKDLAIAQGKVPADVLVYKEVVNDNRLSPECRRLHLSGGEPRLYRLDEVQANGTNRGKPRSAWRIVVEGTHPNCRCTLRPATQEMAEKYLEDQKKDS